MSKVFSFSNYDVIGFDLDNCLCRYHPSELFKLEYDLLSNFIEKQNNHPTESLKKPYDLHKDFILKGLFLDVKKGNVLKIAADGTILQASHGTKQMSPQEIHQIYNDNHWMLTDKYIADPLSVWAGEGSHEIQVVIDYFDLPVALVFARIVDDLDKITIKESYDHYPEILDCIRNIYDHEQLFKNRGGFYTALKKEPAKYLYPRDEKLFDWLKSMKESGKKLYLLSGANYDYGTYISEVTLGENWKELFDLVIFEAKKPWFWNSNRNFKTVDGNIISNKDIKMNEIYLEGNYEGLQALFQKETNIINPKVLYVGDSIIQDVFAPNFYCNIDTVAVVEELEAEGTYGFPQVNTDDGKSIRSNVWGSFFKYNNFDTIWKKYIMQHSIMVTPSIQLMTEHPIEYTYKITL